jgi:murein L,D-transpeptidase YcbB/YkuD
MNENIEQALYDYRGFLVEYYCLASKPELSSEEADRLNEMLYVAESTKILSFWLSEIDYRIGQRLGLLNDHYYHQYEDMKAFLREYLASLNLEASDIYRELQRILQSRGFYCGAVDGIFDQELCNAIHQFQKAHHISSDGVMDFRTLNALCSTPDEITRFARLFSPGIVLGGDYA